MLLRARKLQLRGIYTVLFMLRYLVRVLPNGALFAALPTFGFDDGVFAFSENTIITVLRVYSCPVTSYWKRIATMRRILVISKIET